MVGLSFRLRPSFNAQVTCFCAGQCTKHSSAPRRKKPRLLRALLGKKDCATARTAEPVAASQVVAAPASSLVRLFILQSFRFEEIDREFSTRIDASVSGSGAGVGTSQQLVMARLTVSQPAAAVPQRQVQHASAMLR